MSQGTNKQIDFLKQEIDKTNVKIKKLQLKLQNEKKELKEKRILFNGVKSQYEKYSNLEEKQTNNFYKIQEKLSKCQEEEYQKCVELQKDKYQISLIDYEVDSKAFQKAPFTQKQQFIEFREQDEIALNELDEIEREKRKMKSKQKERAQLIKKIEVTAPKLQQTGRQLKHNQYQKIYYEQMLDDVKYYIAQKQTYISDLEQSISQYQQILDELNSDLQIGMMNNLNFHNCSQKH
ncbi:unnamed protein product (macronuclear) [Paramecium tetraurelia]|uniref:Uncharacterized protein n=1 Tax=Paramecium tetraurelia TaxID=5888 RepID=A0BEF2_PARTE|nr:uncharacterized protein GSPATT00027952001 [Paramecium tetraurelia]CAK56919.1 unnamed protein product [Paramecium tetraurelia]|eukprot:XP_001424317.1 hypothetical protein (macronuclear) [Paramecium tetraurelia strain d4-2]